MKTVAILICDDLAGYLRYLREEGFAVKRIKLSRDQRYNLVTFNDQREK